MASPSVAHNNEQKAWKDAYVPNLESAVDFLYHMGKDITGANVEVTVYDQNLYLDFKKEKAFLLQMEGAKEDQSLLIKDYEACIMGRDLGSIGIKAQLGHARELRANCLIITNVVDDGLSFWPHMGSLPLITQDKSKALLRKHLRHELEHLFSNTEGGVPASYKIACTRFPLHLWRALSQCEHTTCEGIKFYRCAFKKSLAWEICNDHVIPLGEQSTRLVLQKRLGTIPHFHACKGLPRSTYFWEAYCKEKETFPKFQMRHRFSQRLPLQQL